MAEKRVSRKKKKKIFCFHRKDHGLLLSSSSLALACFGCCVPGKGWQTFASEPLEDVLAS